MLLDLSLDCAKIGDAQLDLTTKKFRIFKFLTLRKGAVLRKDKFLDHLHGGIDEPGPKIIDVFMCKIIDVFMCKLHHKLADAGATGVVINMIWRQGYILREMRDCDAMAVSA